MDLITIMRLRCSRRWQWLLRGWSDVALVDASAVLEAKLAGLVT